MKQKIKVTKIFTFEMAHALLGYDGDCKNIHGHSYVLHVTVSGTPIEDDINPKNGMVIDFFDLKMIVKKKIIDKYDHALVLNSKITPAVKETLKKNFGKVYEEKFQPTCENLVLHFVNELKNTLPKEVDLSKVKLFETATSYAEWQR